MGQTSCRPTRCIAATAAFALLIVLAAPAMADDVQEILAAVSQSQFETYQSTVESMGLGLYDANYDQDFRGRDGWEGVGSLGSQETRLYLTDQFAAMGLAVSVQGGYMNVVAELAGTQTPENIYIVGGHYDHVAGDRPGGDDNASGTAGVLEAARVLSQYSFQSTIRFIGFNAEEDGLLGSTDYVNNVVIPGGENVAGMINLDMILRPGWDSNPNAAIDLDLGTRTSETAAVAWANLFKTTAATYVPSLAIDPTILDVHGASDQDPFVTNGYPAFLAIENTPTEIWGGASAYYHTAEDASDRLANDPASPSGVVYDYAFATDVVRASVALLAQEAVIVPEPATGALLAAGALLLLARRRTATPAPRRRRHD